MKTVTKMRLTASVLAVMLVVMIAVPAVAMAAPVPLGTTSTYGVLAGTTITNTGPTTIGGSAGGDIGVSPGTSITGFPPGLASGATHNNDAPAAQAQLDLTAAYLDAEGRTPATPIDHELAGQTLVPGVYSPVGGDFQLSGTLILNSTDPDGVFVFQCPATLTTSSGSRVVLAGQAQFCRVFWQVTSSATLGTNSIFVGHIFALTNITANTGAHIQGQLLARNAAVNLDSNTIINGYCEYSTDIHVVKTASAYSLAAPGSVTYTYTVTNTFGEGPLTNVHLTDDKLGAITSFTGDTNSNGELDTTETWVYTRTTNLTRTTENIAVVTADVGSAPTTDTAVARVTVAAGQLLPNTATPWYTVLLAGVALTLLGAAGYWMTTRKIHA